MSQVATLGPVAPGTVRSVAPYVTINGEAMPGVIGVTVSQKNQFEAGTFTVEAALVPSSGYDLNWWSNQTQVRAKIYVVDTTNPGAGEVRLITGNVDNYRITPATESISLSGRDLTALLIDTKTAQSYGNQNSSEIAATIAGKHDLKTSITATSTPVGTYYASEHNRLVLGALHHSTTEWDLLIYLAQHEGFDVFVDDETLHFQPAQTGAGTIYSVPFAPANGAPPACSLLDLEVEHALTLAPGVSVTVLSWHSGYARQITATAKSSTYDKNAGNTQDYAWYVPNLTLADAQALANQRLLDITRHLRTITMKLPGDTVLTPRMVVRVSGTASGFDGLYYPDDIERECGWGAGFGMSVVAKNIPPAAQQATP